MYDIRNVLSLGIFMDHTYIGAYGMLEIQWNRDRAISK